MSEPLPPELTLIEIPAGARYRLPPRRLGAYRCVGLGLFVLGLILCGAPGFPAWKIVQAVTQQIPASEGCIWLLPGIISLPVCQLGLFLAPLGLFIWAGHSEIELRDGTLYAFERCGPVRWTWARATAGLRRLFVSDDLGALTRWGAGPTGVGVITPEWQPVVDGPPARSMWLAPGYPRPWLLALAQDLAQRCVLTAEESVPATVPVLERGTERSDYEELEEQPAGSRVVVAECADRLTLSVPPVQLWRRGGMVFAGLFVCFCAFGITENLFVPEETAGHPWWVTALCATLTWGVGAGFLLVGAYRAGRGATVLTVTGDTFTVQQAHLFGGTERHWSRREVADVFVEHYPGGEDAADHWELQIHTHTGSKHRLLAYQDRDELRWLATRLRRTLHCPGLTLASPPHGLVVRSPLFALRGLV